MILDCYQCSSCYFEDKKPSSRIHPDTISAPQPRRAFRNVLVAFVCIELYDDRQELKQAAEEFELLTDMIGKRPIVLCPCLLYTSPSPRDLSTSRMPSSA